MIVKREKQQVTVSAYGGQSDTMKIVIPGTDDRLDLNGYIYVGGYINPLPQIPSFHRMSFRGCMYQASITSNYKVDFFKGVVDKNPEFTTKNVVETYSPVISPRSINFDRDAYITFLIQLPDPIDPTKILKKLFGHFQFRTVLFKGTIFRASSVSLQFQQSQLSLHSGGDIVSLDFPQEGQANDGRWFDVGFVVENKNMELRLNDKRARITPSNNPQYGAEVTFGYYQNEQSFIGCIRNLSLQSYDITYYDIVDPYRPQKLAKDFSREHLSEGCKASDPCIPNPCFHGAQCLTVVEGFGVKCDCRLKYKSPLCQFCKYSLCQFFKLCSRNS